MNARSRSLRIGLFVAFVLFVSATLAVHSYSRWTDNFYTGKVVSIDNEQIGIQSPDGRITHMLLSESVQIQYGRTSGSLEVGQLIAATGAKQSDGTVVVESIRIFDKHGSRSQ